MSSYFEDVSQASGSAQVPADPSGMSGGQSDDGQAVSPVRPNIASHVLSTV